MNCDPSSLMQAAACFDKCIPPGDRQSIKSYLLCQYANAAAIAFSLTITGNGSAITGTWNVPPSQYTKTEVWTSTDGVTFALEVTVASPGTSTTSFTYPAAGGTKYAKIRYCDNSSTCTAFSSVQSVVYTVGMEWATRVVTNGGVRPGVSSVNAQDTFYNSLVSSGLLTKMKVVNTIAPDSVTAAKTPLLRGTGNDPWVGTGGVTVNGWLTTAAALDTGFNPSAVFSTTNAGWSVYFFSAGPSSIPDSGNAAIGCRTTGAARFFMCNPSSANLWYGWCFTNDASSLLAQAFVTHNAGLWTLNRRANNILEAYRGQGTFAPGTSELEYSTAVVGTASPPNASWYFGGENLDGVNTPDTTRILSFGALHDGLTGAETQTLYVAVDTIRHAYGGGFV